MVQKQEAKDMEEKDLEERHSEEKAKDTGRQEKAEASQDGAKEAEKAKEGRATGKAAESHMERAAKAKEARPEKDGEKARAMGCTSWTCGQEMDHRDRIGGGLATMKVGTPQ